MVHTQSKKRQDPESKINRSNSGYFHSFFVLFPEFRQNVGLGRPYFLAKNIKKKQAYMKKKEIILRENINFVNKT